jgi:DMSO/TMAO reductase YedYZ molybdopterin-dependent catalytic subunit
MIDSGYTRRDFLKTATAATAMAMLGDVPALSYGAERKLVRYPEKDDLLLLTSRPPQLETPVRFFREPVTPNSAVFVRWHIDDIPTSVDLSQWRLKVRGNVEQELNLSMDEIKRSFDKVSYTAVIQCSGNGRSFFEPKVPGGQWAHGAMGNVTWAGARLKNMLAKAGLKAGSVDVAFDGLDSASMATVSDFVKSLPVDKATEDDLIVAYEMNGQPLTMLNGFPARLVVPGWYATYWVKALTDIKVLNTPFDGFWMAKAYRMPDTPCGCVPPGTAPKKTIPVHRMVTRSLIVDPPAGATFKANRPVEVMGIAFSGGYSIREVIVSVDGGKTWKEAKLGKDYGRYAWVQFFYSWKPPKPGNYTLMAKATNSIGESQPHELLWNPPGYFLNRVERVEIAVK